ncbi:receptor activity-modifying protein 3 isoform X1 [Macaca fascicularis]|uniref:receptor activity-modifying protein 3 isoform X1 n=1 Tax=Macaca fascicularis TaxID=9541 RepID=UPI0003ABC190
METGARRRPQLLPLLLLLCGSHSVAQSGVQWCNHSSLQPQTPQAILPLQPPKWLGLQVCAITSDCLFDDGRSGGCPRAGGCNETGLLERLPLCGKAFADMMGKVDVWKWCNLSEFIVYYESFTNCTEMEANIVGCYWPNPLAQGFITGIHRQFFSNCTMDKVHLEDPPDEVLIPLIIIPVVLTVAMAGLVVWRSKRTDTLL